MLTVCSFFSFFTRSFSVPWHYEELYQPLSRAPTRSKSRSMVRPIKLFASDQPVWHGIRLNRLDPTNLNSVPRCYFEVPSLTIWTSEKLEETPTYPDSDNLICKCWSHKITSISPTHLDPQFFLILVFFKARSHFSSVSQSSLHLKSVHNLISVPCTR